MSFIFFGNTLQIPRCEQVVNDLMSKSADFLSKKNKMRAVGITVSMPGGIVKSLGLEFDVVGPLTKEGIRKILVDSSDKFLCAINQDVDVRPYLECYPFTREMVDIVLFFYDKDHVGLKHPHIGIASIRGKKLHYKTLITIDKIPKIENEYVESEEEALEALKG